ncbi:winged helix-turn-helix domain-containing protein [Serratia sp. root2]|uniref:winged helix-turn-helix domain-containing protein n=1 Tax=Serratia sp. root2 TaxID=3059676 RepID=UPI00288C8443|nr:winged helix-turn-helix domain-containing protein [Serratia sp. root2]MDT3252446.1 winged helix-turn-helix domain-containing protein [Serratia sp. root2]
MKFIINKRLKFHDDRSLLEIIDDPMEAVVLTATLSRLLSLLVRNNNTLLTRDYILTQVWDDHGQTASNNNLNNYISMLRKTLSTLGESDIIVTMPRQGFMFTAADINTIDDEIIINGTNLTARETPPLPKRKLVWPKKWVLAICVMATIATAGVARFSSGYKPLSYKDMGTIGSCNLKLVTTYHPIEKVAANLNELSKQLAGLGFDCSTPATVYYYSSKMLVGKIEKGDALYFISYCPLTTARQNTTQCKNVYENSHI